MAEIALTPREFRILESLRLKPRRAFRGSIRGERLSKRKGISIEFADFREYSEGDDLRHLDWNVLGRLDTAVMRTYQDEEDLLVYVFVDVSPSMEFGEPSKLDYAKRMGAALGLVALSGGDALLPRWLGARRAPVGAIRGRVGLTRMLHFFGSLQEPENTDTLADGLRLFARSSAKPGLVILVTDGLDEQLPSVISALGPRGFEVGLLQILSEIELDPDLEGDLKLVDAEGGTPREVTANRDTINVYKQRLKDHNDRLQQAIVKCQGRYELVSTSEPLEEVVGSRLKRSGWFE